MRKSILALGLLLAGGAFAAPTEAPPSKPLVANAPASSQWTVTCKPKALDSKRETATEAQDRKMRERYSPLVLSTHTIKAPEKMVIYTTYEAGLKSEAWLASGYMYGLPLHEGESMRINAKGTSDFPEFSWISEENFQGTVELQKRKVHLYEMEVSNPNPTPEPSASPAKKKSDTKASEKPMRRAYIDPETKLPVKLETESNVMTYEFEDAPETFPTMNERVAELTKQPKE